VKRALIGADAWGYIDGARLCCHWE